MSYNFTDYIAYTCGTGPDDAGDVSVTIGYEIDKEGEAENFSFEFKDSALTVRCSKELAAEIASAFAAVAEG